MHTLTCTHTYNTSWATIWILYIELSIFPFLAYTYLEVTKNHKSYKNILRGTHWCVMMVLRWDHAQVGGHTDGVEKLDGAPNTEEDEHDGNEGELPICLLHCSHQLRTQVLTGLTLPCLGEEDETRFIICSRVICYQHGFAKCFFFFSGPLAKF